MERSDTVRRGTVRAWEIVNSGQRILVLAGAGISTDSGIPDFRGPQGVWTKDPSAEKLATFDSYVTDPAVRVACLAEPPNFSDLGRKAESRSPCTPRAREERSSRAPRHPERRRAAPDGGSRPLTGRGDPRDDEENRLPALRRTAPVCRGPRAGRRRRVQTRRARRSRRRARAAGSSSRTRSASGRTWSQKTCADRSERRCRAT